MALGTSTMSLLDLTSAYAGDRGQCLSGRAACFRAAREAAGLKERLVDGPSSLNRAIPTARWRRCCARRSIRAPGAHGNVEPRPTSARPAPRRTIAMRYSSAMRAIWWSVCGSAMTTIHRSTGITGGGLPARIWRDFMTQALGVSAGSPASPRPRENADPGGPIEPLDVPEPGGHPSGRWQQPPAHPGRRSGLLDRGRRHSDRHHDQRRQSFDRRGGLSSKRGAGPKRRATKRIRRELERRR